MAKKPHNPIVFWSIWLGSIIAVAGSVTLYVVFQHPLFIPLMAFFVFKALYLLADYYDSKPFLNFSDKFVGKFLDIIIKLLKD